MSESKETKNHSFSYGPLVLSTLFLAGMVVFGMGSKPEKTETLSAQTLSYSFQHSEFEQVVLEADAVYIENMETGKPLFQKNARDIHPLASLAKIMTTHAALTLFPEEATLQIAGEDLSGAGDQGLVPGERWGLRDLLVLMLVASSNDAALAIEREAKQYTGGISFPEYMTQEATRLGFSSLTFSNASGLDLDEAETLPGALGTAEEISKLFRLVYMSHPEIFDRTKESSVTLSSDIEEHVFENTNTSLHSMPGVVGSKTGYTNTAGGNLSVVVSIDEVPHVVTVLQSSRSGRFRDVQEIIGLIQKEYAQLESY